MAFNLSSLLSGMHDDEESFNIARVDLSSNTDKPFIGSEAKENNGVQPQPNMNLTNNQSPLTGKSTPVSQASTDEFDPNEMFDIGIRNVEGNPFSQEELSKLADDLNERSDPDKAQTLSIPTFEETPVTQSYETNISDSTTKVVANDDGMDFELVSSQSEIIVESEINLGIGSEHEIEIEIDLTSINAGTDTMFDILSNQAEEINSVEYAEKFNPNAVISSELTEEEGSVITVEEEQIITIQDNSPLTEHNNVTQQSEIQVETGVGVVAESNNIEIEVLDHSIEEQKEFDYISQIDKIHGSENNNTNLPTQEQYYGNLAPNEQAYQNDAYQQPANGPVTSPQPVAKDNSGEFPMYETHLGDKIRLQHTKENKPSFETTNPHILDFDSLIVGQDIEGEVLVKEVKIIPYGNNGQTRVEWTVETKNKVEYKFSQFNLSDAIQQSELTPYVNHTVTLNGKVGTRNNAKNLVVTLVGLPKYTTPTDFGVGINTPQADLEMETYKNWYRSLTGQIKSPWMKLLIKECLEKSGNLARMVQSSAGSKVHDANEGGLLKHTMKVTMNSYLVARNYPYVNQDVIIVSSLLHDIGKIYEMENGKYTQLGELTGHIVIGQTIVSNAIQALKNNGVEVNENESANIIHCILAHHGNLEWGSPVKPKTPEAMLLHLVDMIDARLTHMDETLSGKDKAYSKTFGTSVFNLN